MAGEEVVGGIKGFLTLDADQFHREILRAIAEAEMLDGKKVDVKIDVHGDKVSQDLGKITRGLDDATTSSQKLGTSFASSGMRSGPLLIGGIAAGMALVGPVAGAATAAVVGFTGVVGAGVLAWQGFKDEIESGTELGQQLQAEIDGIGDAVQRLQTTAAGAASGGVLAGLEHVGEWLPSVNDDVAILSTHLGSAFNISTQALTSGLDTLMPLLQDGGIYAEKFAIALKNGAESQEFKDFVAYSREQLPAFIELVSSLTAGFVQMGVALAPVGEFIVASMTLTGKSLDATGQALQFVSKNFNPVVAGLNLLSGGAKTAATDTGAATTAVQQFSPALTAQATALGTTAAALTAAKTQQEAHTTAASAATIQMQLENNAAGLLKQGLDALNGVNLSLSSAQTNSASATMGMTTALKASNGSLSLNTAAGIAARQSIEGKARADQDLATATATATGSTKAGTTSLQASKDAAIKAAQASGTLTDEVRKYIEKLYAVPKNVPPTKLEVDKAAAANDIGEHMRLLSKIPATKTTTVRTVYTYQGQQYQAGVIGGSVANAARRAKGGIVGYAGGGVPGEGGGKVIGPGTGTSDSVMAMIRQSRKPIMLSNEEFVSTAASQRRNRGALEAGNKGATLSAGSTKRETNFNFHGNIVTPNPEDFMRQMRQMQRQSALDGRD